MVYGLDAFCKNMTACYDNYSYELHSEIKNFLKKLYQFLVHVVRFSQELAF